MIETQSGSNRSGSPRKLTEDRKEYSRAYYQKHKDDFRRYAVTYKAAHPQMVLKHAVDTRLRLKNAVLVAYSIGGIPKCSHCDISDIDVLCIDHINNNGAEEKIRNGSMLYQRLKTANFPLGYQVLCWNCNHKKEMERLRNSRKPTPSSTR